MRRLVPVLTPVLLFLLAGCAEERGAGNSIETENSVAARMLPVDSLLGIQGTPQPRTMIATLRLARENFHFEHSSRDGHDLRLESSQGDPLPFHIVFWDSAASLGRINVRLDSGILASNREIRMRWNTEQTKTLSDYASTWKGFTPNQILQWNSVLVDDFEDGNDTSSLPTRALWRNSLTTNASLTLNVAESGRNRPGKSLRATYSANYPSYVLVGVPFGSRPVVGRSLDSLVFYVRGKGLFYVAFEHLNGSLGPKAWLRFYLDSNWTRRSIRPSDLEIGNGNGMAFDWNRVKDSLTDLTFFAQDGSEFQLDDIRLHGISPGDLH